MKTLTKNNLSIYLFDDAEPLAITASEITVGSPAKLIIGDCNASNTVLHENVTAPEDWYGHKYLFDGTAWTLNPNWVDPTPQPQPE
jgi:hypothetical protein